MSKKLADWLTPIINLMLSPAPFEYNVVQIAPARGTLHIREDCKDMH